MRRCSSRWWEDTNAEWERARRESGAKPGGAKVRRRKRKAKGETALATHRRLASGEPSCED